MSALHYCKGWFRAKKVALEAYTEEQAKIRHNAGELYCVLVGSPEAPSAFLEIGNGFIGIYFLDDHLRENLSYSFKQVEPGRLFLSMAVWREFAGESDQVSLGYVYTFKQNGKVSIRREQFLPTHLVETAESTTDVGKNWNTVPAFGQYDDLLEVERPNV